MLAFFSFIRYNNQRLMDGFPSGQRGQTVNLLAPPSKVRILLHPLFVRCGFVLCGQSRFLFSQTFFIKSGDTACQMISHLFCCISLFILLLIFMIKNHCSEARHRQTYNTGFYCIFFLFFCKIISVCTQDTDKRCILHPADTCFVKLDLHFPVL